MRGKLAVAALALTLSAVSGADVCAAAYFGAPPVVVLGCCSVCFGPL
jgi:hypothetical protein